MGTTYPAAVFSCDASGCDKQRVEGKPFDLAVEIQHPLGWWKLSGSDMASKPYLFCSYDYLEAWVRANTPPF